MYFLTYILCELLYSDAVCVHFYYVWIENLIKLSDMQHENKLLLLLLTETEKLYRHVYVQSGAIHVQFKFINILRDLRGDR